jgi:hypothetical protein
MPIVVVRRRRATTAITVPESNRGAVQVAL